MIRIVHTADIHLGMENYGKIDPHTGIHTRLLDFAHSLNTCVNYAIAEQADLFLFAGDAYKTAHPTPTQQRLLMEAFLRLFRAEIPIVMIIGNHDNALSFGKAHALEIFGQVPLDGFHVIGKPTTLQLSTRNGPLNIVGIPWPARTTLSLEPAHLEHSGSELSDQISAYVSRTIQEHAEQLDPAIPAILTGHLTVAVGIFSGSEKRALHGSDPLFSVADLAIPPFDYVALGHLHRYQNLNPHDYPAVVYSGSIDRVDFGERSETKGFCVIEIPAKGEATHQFIPLKTRPFVQIEVELSSGADHTAQMLEAIEEHDITRAIVKIVYHVPEGVRDMIDKLKIQAACAPAHYLTGIIPVRNIRPAKPRNTALSADMNLQTVLATYLSEKQNLSKADIDRLVKKALAFAHVQEMGNRISEL